MLKLKINLVIVFILIIPSYLFCQTTLVSGSSFENRTEALIKVMTGIPIDGSRSVPKYAGPYLFARLLKGVEVEDALIQLDKMYSTLLEPRNRSLLDGSNIHFFDHATMHGYMLTKDKLPESLRLKIKKFMQLSDFSNPKGTLNMELMMRSAAIIAAEEWPDFTDAKGNNAQQILSFNRPVLMKYLHQFFSNNCPEADAFTYFSTNVMYVRMLAEYSRDIELSKCAESTFQYMVTSLIPGWNQGIYVANPPRSKGWGNLMTGSQIGSNAITLLCWSYFGDRDNQIEVSTKAGNENFALNFWMFYPGRIKPNPAIFACYQEKKYPYVHQALLDVANAARFYKYTYQSDNYGMASQSELPHKLAESQYTYNYKETKRLYLAWQSDVIPGIFSVCQDNPERPQRYQAISNRLGYGENPYQRVLQSRKAAIGIYNVPGDYMDLPNFYRIYVPFTRKGIKLRTEEQGWIFCHTGTMMFAFKTIEPYTWDKTRFSMTEHDVLTLQDTICRKGGWVLETSEITARYKSGSVQKELENFKKDILANCKIDTFNYQTLHPRLRYFSLDKELIDLTFFGPEESYVDQYRINEVSIVFKDQYVWDNPYLKQLANSDEISFISTKGIKKFSWLAGFY